MTGLPLWQTLLGPLEPCLLPGLSSPHSSEVCDWVLIRKQEQKVSRYFMVSLFKQPTLMSCSPQDKRPTLNMAEKKPKLFMICLPSPLHPFSISCLVLCLSRPEVSRTYYSLSYRCIFIQVTAISSSQFIRTSKALLTSPSHVLLQCSTDSRLQHFSYFIESCFQFLFAYWVTCSSRVSFIHLIFISNSKNKFLLFFLITAHFPLCLEKLLQGIFGTPPFPLLFHSSFNSKCQWLHLANSVFIHFTYSFTTILDQFLIQIMRIPSKLDSLLPLFLFVKSDTQYITSLPKIF